MPFPRSRAWTFVINNDKYSDLLSMLNTPYRYLIFGFEICPTTGTPHIQGYIYFDEAISMKSCSRIFPRARLVASKGTAFENEIYIAKLQSKESCDDWYEFGDRPTQGKCKWDQIEEVMKDPFSNPHLYQQYNKMYRQLVTNVKKDHTREMILVEYKDRYIVANMMKDSYSVVFLDTDDIYDSQEVVFIGCYDAAGYIDWINGYPKSIKRGYELICIDPRLVYVMYKDIYEYNYIIKICGEYIVNNASDVW